MVTFLRLWRSCNCSQKLSAYYLFIFIYFVVLGFELASSRLQGRCSTTWATLFMCACVGIFEIGSQKLFAWAGLKTPSSWSLSPKWLGLQLWATGAPAAWCILCWRHWKLWRVGPPGMELVFLFIYLYSTRVWTQSLVFAKQALYYLSRFTSLWN
jgi:hypothetical protein